MMPLWTTTNELSASDRCGCELISLGTPCVAQRVCAMPTWLYNSVSGVALPVSQATMEMRENVINVFLFFYFQITVGEIENYKIKWKIACNSYRRWLLPVRFELCPYVSPIQYRGHRLNRLLNRLNRNHGTPNVSDHSPNSPTLLCVFLVSSSSNRRKFLWIEESEWVWIHFIYFAWKISQKNAQFHYPNYQMTKHWLPWLKQSKIFVINSSLIAVDFPPIN